MRTNEKGTKIDKKPFFISFTLCLLVALSHVFFRNADYYHDFGIYPKDWWHLHGIISSPFAHGSWGHLGNNLFSLFILAYLVTGNYPKVAWKILLYGTLMTGLYVWLFARPSYHIGASGVVYMLSGFIIVSAIIRRERKSVAMAFLIIMINGSFIWGAMPDSWLHEWLGVDVSTRHISWESHLFGILAGGVLGVYFRKNGPQAPKKDWNVYDPQLEYLTHVYEEYMEQIEGGKDADKSKENDFKKEKINLSNPTRINYVFKSKESD